LCEAEEEEMNFINWLLGIGPNQFTPEQQMPHPPKDYDEDDFMPEDDDDDDIPTNLGRPRG
jgi:hypothetical protein